MTARGFAQLSTHQRDWLEVRQMLVEATQEAITMAMYFWLRANSHSHTCGLYSFHPFMPEMDIGITTEQTMEAIAELEASGAIDFDADANLVLVHGMAQIQAAGFEKPTDNKFKSAVSHLAALPDSPLISTLYDQYPQLQRSPLGRGVGIGEASKGLRRGLEGAPGEIDIPLREVAQ